MFLPGEIAGELVIGLPAGFRHSTRSAGTRSRSS